MQNKNFFDRKIYLDILQKRVIALKDGYRQNIAIIGDELAGKTSLVHAFLSSFLDTRFVMVYVEARPETLPAFCRRFAGILLYNFLAASHIPLKEDLDFLLEKSSVYIPKTVAKAKEIMADAERRKKENVFSELLSLTGLINQETGKFCVLIIDEFQNLEGLGTKSLYKEWAQRLLTEKTTLYVIISSMLYKAKAILANELSLLFGNFEVITVEPFDIPTSMEFLLRRMGARAAPGHVRDTIVYFTGGNPWYLDVIADALAQSPRQDLTDTLENLLFSTSGVLHQRFTSSLKRFQDSQFSHDYLGILHLVSSGQNKIKDIAHILKKPASLVSQRVSYLLGIDVVKRWGDFLQLSDRVFGFWLKFVYQEKLQSLTFDAVNQKALFRRNIEQMMQEYLASCCRPVSERITELLRLFADERVQIERRKVTLNHFREIKPLGFRGRGLKEGLLCRSLESLWIFGLSPDMLSEEDIAEFARECKKYRSKLQQKIIITMRDIDPNSRLKALEEKVWTWDLNNVNQLLDLFSRPRIISPEPWDGSLSKPVLP